MNTTQNYLLQIRQKELRTMSKFVVTENFKHHSDNILPKDYREQIDSVFKEEANYLKNSKIYSVKSEVGVVLGTIRVLKWDFVTPLPIQKMFGINPLMFTEGNDIHDIWHIGRFAIKKGTRDLNLLKKLMVSAIKPVCEHKNNIAFAECDAKLLRVMNLMGIGTKIVGESIHYLGSETIPVCMSYDGLIGFYNENKYLIESEDAERKSDKDIALNNMMLNANHNRALA